MPRIEQVLRRNHGEFDLRTATAEEISYEVRLPHDRRTEGVSNQLLELEQLGVNWDEKNDK